TAPQNPRHLPNLPRGHPRRKGQRTHPELTTGEPCDGKPSSTVREGADGKGPTPRAPRRRPTSLGERSGETDREQSRYRAPGRLSEANVSTISRSRTTRSIRVPRFR